MTLVPALAIVLFFIRQLVDAANVSFPVDIAMILMPATSGEKFFYINFADKFFEHYKFGDDKARLALVNAYVPKKDKENLVLQPLTADTQLIKKKLVEWNRTAPADPVRDFAAALRVLSPQVFINSNNRAKAVFMVIVTHITDDQVVPMFNATRQLRDEGCNIYAAIASHNMRATFITPNFTGYHEKVFYYDVLLPYWYDRIADNTTTPLFKAMDKDLANMTIRPTPATTRPSTGPTHSPTGPTHSPTGPTHPPTGPTHPPTQPSPKPPPAGKETTTSRGVVAKPAPPLQWASRLLIGLAVGHFRFII